MLQTCVERAYVQRALAQLGAMEVTPELQIQQKPESCRMIGLFPEFLHGFISVLDRLHLICTQRKPSAEYPQIR